MNENALTAITTKLIDAHIRKYEILLCLKRTSQATGILQNRIYKLHCHMTITWQLNVYSRKTHVACIILYMYLHVSTIFYSLHLHVSIHQMSSIHPSSNHFIYPSIFYSFHLSIHLLFISSIHPSSNHYIYSSIF